MGESGVAGMRMDSTGSRLVLGGTTGRIRGCILVGGDGSLGMDFVPGSVSCLCLVLVDRDGNCQLPL